MDRVEALGGGKRVGQLAPHLGNLPHRHEGGQREERQERHDPRVERAVCREGSAGGGDGEATQPCRDFLQGALARQIPEERHAGLRVGVGSRGELRVTT